MTRGLRRWRLPATGLAAALLWVASGHGQGIGLPQQARDPPIEIVARDGLEWNREAKSYTARGEVRAAQGDVVIHADELTVSYSEGDGGMSIRRMEALGNVRIATPTQEASGNRGVYDVGSGVFVLTGNIRLVTETDRITARDSLEYRERENVVIARGRATARREGNTLRAGILKARLATGADGRARVKHIAAAEDVVVRTDEEVVRSRTGAYDVDSGVVTLAGSVRITRGSSQLNGDRATVNLRTGVSELFGGSGGRVRGLLVPERRSGRDAKR